MDAHFKQNFHHHSSLACKTCSLHELMGHTHPPPKLYCTYMSVLANTLMLKECCSTSGGSSASEGSDVNSGLSSDSDPFWAIVMVSLTLLN